MSDSNKSLATTRCRFAPSPTGMLHVGGARTALFNYLFARASGGKYLLRVEDSDRQRSTDEALDAIIEGLQWLGINHDEEIVFQSQRTELYLNSVKKLLALGHAYPCDVSMEELDALREAQRARDEKPRYDGRCRPETICAQPTDIPTGEDKTPFVIRIRMPEQEAIVFEDEILGTIRTSMDELDDFILVRSDATPTYNLVNAVDDIEMKISHVLRGNEHVANTPKQIAIYNALGAELPVFAHFPLILGPDKKKLSKRHGATAVFQYRDDGYMPDAFVNYLARLGWSDGDQELFDRKELESQFKLSGVGKSPSVFDVDKLRWVNAEHMKKTPLPELLEAVLPYIATNDNINTEEITRALATETGSKLIEGTRERSKTLVELAEGVAWLFIQDDKLVIDEKDRGKFFKEAIAQPWQDLITRLEAIESFQSEKIEEMFSAFLEANSLSFGKMGQPLRLALCGQKGGVPIFLALEVLGKNRSLQRLRQASQWFTN